MFKTVVTIRTLTLLLASALTVRAHASDIAFVISGSSPYCMGSGATVDYDGTGTTFTSGNTFTVQLSDETGSFAAPVDIGSVNTTNATGTISITMPIGVPGTGYRIRITSTAPAIISSDNGSDIIIAESIVPTISITSDASAAVGAGSVVYFSSTVFGGGSSPVIQWTRNGNSAGTGNAFVVDGAVDGDEVQATLTSNLSCANPTTATSNAINIDVDDDLTQSNHTWESRATQSVASVFIDRSNASGFTISTTGRAYIGCGSSTTNTYRKDFWEYNPQTDTWTQKADVGQPANPSAPGRFNAVGFSVGTKGFIGTGMSSTGVRKDFYQYDPETNTWLQRTDFPGLAREQAFGFGINGSVLRGYVGGGTAPGSDFQDFYEFNPASNDWTAKADFGGGKRMGSAAFSTGDSGFVIGGYSTSLNTYHNDTWAFDQSNVWTQKASMPGNGRTRATAFAVAGNGYVGLGYSAEGYEGQFYKYDVAGDSWTQKPSFPGPTTKTFGVGLSVNNHAYIYKDGTMTEYNFFTTTAFPSKMCTTESIPVSFDASGFTFGANNVFTAQISSQANFSVTTTLSSLSSSASSGSINAVIPTSADGTYYFRIQSSNPQLTTLLEQITVTNVPANHTIVSDRGTTICKDAVVTFSSTLDPGTGYQWYKNNNLVGSDDVEYVDNALVNGDAIKAVRTYMQGCKGPVNVTSNIITMTVRSPAKPTITISQPNTLTSTVATSYQWYKDNLPISKATSQSYTMTESGIYKVRINDSFGCFAYSDDLVDAFTGLEDNTYSLEVLTYPSPFSTDMYLSLTDDIVAQGCGFKLVNELGQTVMDNPRAEKINRLDMSGKAPGLYILKVSFGHSMVVRKLMKVN